MSWRDTIRPASFRGVAFYVDGDDHDFGQRKAIADFPERDKPRGQDFGQKAKSFGFTAFVIGDDYLDQETKLIAACDAKAGGELIHPKYGRKWCECIESSVSHSSDELGIGKFTLKFVEVEEGATAPSEDLQAQAVAAAATVHASAATDLAANFTAAAPDWVIDEAQTIAQKFNAQITAAAAKLTGFGAPLNDFIAKAQALSADFRTLVNAPLDMAGQISDLVRGLNSLASGPRAAYSVLKTLFGFGSGFSSPPNTTPNRRIQIANQAAFVAIIGQVAAAEAIIAATEFEFNSFDDATQFRDELVGFLDEMALSAGDEAFIALRAARAAIVKDINARGADLARLYKYTPNQTEPALVIAHRIYGGNLLLENEAEILNRNQIKHPLFVPGGQELEVRNV